MSRSMTGFGKATGEFDGQTLTVELSSVNGRYLDCSLRIPPAWSALEPVVKQTVRNFIARGKVNVTINRRRGNSSVRSVHFDPAVAQQYLDASKALGSMLGSFETLSLNVLAQLEGVMYQEEAEEDIEAIQPVLVGVLEEALRKLDAMRAVEGKALLEDIRSRIGLMRKGLNAVEERLPELNAIYEARLRTRIEELKASAGLTEERIAIEVALMAEKSDVTEEVVRFKTHLDHMEEILGSKEPAGRRLDFLTQEIQREANTLGVKTRDANVAKEVLELKSELEKIREQIQNIE
ncbi:MAG: YicC family protein [Candidatus Hydrogenedentes bacterium]|nr:YicC family protein [Candidatus Hydrogenedentota bacterium]